MEQSQSQQQSFWNKCNVPIWTQCVGRSGENAAHSSLDDVDSIVEETTPQQPPRMRNWVDGILTPFMNCVQPSLGACVAPDAPWEPPTSKCSHRQERSRRVAPEVLLAPPTISPTTREVPNENDVLCGRGNTNNRHTGNQHFRDLIAANKGVYTGLTKKEKMMLARQIVDLILLHTKPAGRFLCRDTNTGVWFDIGLPRSLEKTSQALREKSGKTLEQDASQPKHSRNYGYVKPPQVIIPEYLKPVFRKRREQESEEEFVQTLVLSAEPHRPHHQYGPPPFHLPPFRPTPYSYTAHLPPPQHFSHQHHAYEQHHNDHLYRHPYPQQPPPPSTMSTPLRADFAPPTAVVTPLHQHRDKTPPHTRERPPIQASPSRQQEWKRQRTSSGTTHRVVASESPQDELNTSNASSTGLTQAIESQLTLEPIVSPTSLNQTYASRGRSSLERPKKVTNTLNESADSHMDGLAALSAAAYLRLDESY